MSNEKSTQAADDQGLRGLTQSPARVFSGVEELRSAVGEDLGYSGWHTIDQHLIDRFAEATGDHQWIHVDPDRSRTGPFGGTVAHGFLSLSLLPVLMAEIAQVKGVAMGLNYGLNRVRFPAPLPSGSRVRARASVSSVDDTDDGGVQVVYHVIVETSAGTKPVCVADGISRYYFHRA